MPQVHLFARRSKCTYEGDKPGEWRYRLNTQYPNITHRMQSQQRRCTNRAVFQPQSGFSLRGPQRLRRQTTSRSKRLTLSSTRVTRENLKSQLAVTVAWEKTGDPAYYVGPNLTQRRASSTPVAWKDPSKHD